jgi:hypothetical protein
MFLAEPFAEAEAGHEFLQDVTDRGAAFFALQRFFQSAPLGKNPRS